MEGLTCNRCKDGFYDFPKCQGIVFSLKVLTYFIFYWSISFYTACQCDDQGRKNNICNKETGDCDCIRNVKGDLCEECIENHYDFPTGKACHCDKKGSTNKACNVDSGDCDCLPNVCGPKCDKCSRHYFPDPFPNCKGIQMSSIKKIFINN